ncbi:MAG: flagellar biosynthetic protein FliO [Butyribacter sp.]|nr:flagellar biosynthetic protein FliO [bacterium]MDY3855253.1 flagellar biosynthetic protein FliO [Butyribacter sp.]
MLLYVYGISTLASVFKLILLLLLFIGLLVAAHLFTKWYAKSGYANAKTTNISIIESQQLAPGKNLMIAKVGKKYVSFILLKDNAEFLTELEEEDLVLTPPQQSQNLSFKEIFSKMKNKEE